MVDPGVRAGGVRGGLQEEGAAGASASAASAAHQPAGASGEACCGDVLG